MDGQVEDFEDKSEPMKKSFKMTAPVYVLQRVSLKDVNSQGAEHGHYTFSQGHLNYTRMLNAIEGPDGKRYWEDMERGAEKRGRLAHSTLGSDRRVQESDQESWDQG